MGALYLIYDVVQEIFISILIAFKAKKQISISNVNILNNYIHKLMIRNFVLSEVISNSKYTFILKLKFQLC